jgi:hypothetical protein
VHPDARAHTLSRGMLLLYAGRPDITQAYTRLHMWLRAYNFPMAVSV